MSIFGWDYPPGCSGTPYDEDYPCDVCGQFERKCICPECPECGEIGREACYTEHSLVRTQEQIISLADAEKQWAEDAARYEPEPPMDGE